MQTASDSSSTVILVTRFGIGSGDAALQQQLAVKYFELLLQDGRSPGAICFMTDGVRLVCTSSPALDQLRRLQEHGTHLIVCKTCLDFYGLSDQVELGLVGGMGDIIEAEWRADKVISV